MENHQQEPSPTAKRSPRPPPLSVSLQPADPDPPPRRDQPKPAPAESPHSPLRSQSSLRSDEPEPPASPLPSPPKSNGGATVAFVEKYYSPLTSPLPTTPPEDSSTPGSFPPPISHHHVISFNRREEPPHQTGVVYGRGGERKRRLTFGIGGVTKKEGVINMVALGLRVLEFVFCLVSFSVMASNKTDGWSGDSFDRYKEYRFCLTVTIMGFLYAGFQMFDLATGKRFLTFKHRHQFNFILDQILSYLLISASSAAASRVNDWQTNWGKDEFTEKASASISMAFLAFIAFAISSLISGYNLCIREMS